MIPVTVNSEAPGGRVVIVGWSLVEAEELTVGIVCMGRPELFGVSFKDDGMGSGLDLCNDVVDGGGTTANDVKEDSVGKLSDVEIGVGVLPNDVMMLFVHGTLR